MTAGAGSTISATVTDELLERFERFFSAVNDNATPYPWQRALVAEIAATGRWPEAIAMPTGAGKSSVVDIHVFLVAERARLVAANAAGDRRSAPIARPPRRLVLVAPRRALVEDQAARAEALARRLESASADADDPIVAEVAEALRGLLTTDDATVNGKSDVASPLGVTRLRGGVRLDLHWRLDPSQCQVICATPLMWGSRLLLRGYRSRIRARNLETGLLAHDVAVVIDEAHLHERLVETTRRVANDNAGPLRLQAVAMSATRAAPGARRLSEDDLRDESLRRRVHATKRLSVVEVEDWRRDAAAELAEQATALAGRGTVGVFVNTVAMALDVADRLEGEVVVVCGRMRPADVARVRSEHDGLLDARGDDRVDFLVATQSLEVGIDLDLPAMVTAIASPSALAQRAGRLNRSGKHEEAELVVVAPGALDESDAASLDRVLAPYSGVDIVAAARWLRALDGDASPARISEVPPPSDEMALPLPPLTRVELETLAIAGHELSADVDVAFYVEEPRDRAERDVAICARKHLDLPPEVVRAALLAAPPRAHELATVTLNGPVVASVLDRVRRAGGQAWLMRDSGGGSTAIPLTDGVELEPGDVIVVPDGSPVCTRGIIGVPRARGGQPIDDVSAARPDGPPDQIISLEAAVIAPVRAEDPTLGSRAARNALAEILRREGHASAAEQLRRHRRLSDLEVTWCRPVADDERGARGLLVLTSTVNEGVLPSTVSSDEPVEIDAHQQAVEERLARVLASLDIDAEGDLGVRAEQLLMAARWHDEGKRHPRFQQRMGADLAGPALAKPAPGHRADRGDGYRHEQASGAYIWMRSGRDAVATNIGLTHHGHGLPLFDRDPAGVTAHWDDCPEEVHAGLDELFGPHGRYELERTRLIRKLGLHRLTYLEALLRCADMQISREGR